MVGCMVGCQVAELVCTAENKIVLRASLAAGVNKRMPKRMLSTSKSQGMDDNASPMTKDLSVLA